MKPKAAHLKYRVPYADTDQMGVVYYANYLVYFERARTELLRCLGLPYKEIERRGYALPVIEAHVRYHAPALYDSELDISGRIAWARGARVRIECTVHCTGTLLAAGYTLHACVRSKSMRPVRLPPELVAWQVSPEAAAENDHAPAEQE